MPYPDYDNVKKQLGYGIQTESKDNAIKAINQLQAKVAELEAENARLRTVPMKYRRMAFNAQLQDENKELRAQLAKVEQRVAEACIALIEDRLGELDGQDSEWAAGQVGAIGEIADGGWRKFVKEM